MTLRGHHWIAITLILITGIAAVVYLLYREEALQEHANYSRLLLSIKEKETRLDREVLKVTSYQTNQYDVLVDTANEYQSLLNDLKQLSAKSTGTGSLRLRQELDSYEQHIVEKLTLIERVKSAAGLIRNNLNYLPILVGQYNQQSVQPADKLTRLLSQLFKYNLFPGRLELRSIRQQIDTLDVQEHPSAEQAQILEDVGFHMQASLRHMQILDNLEQELADIGSDGHFEALHAAAQRYRKHDHALFSYFGLLMLILAGGLALGVSELLRRLAKARQVAERSWQRLHDAVNSLNEAFALFDNKGLLVLANQTWEKFYPWLKGNMLVSTPHAELYKLSATHLCRSSMSGNPVAAEDLASFDEPCFLERVDENKWYLASDTQTLEGGLVCVRSNITESKQNELQLWKMSQALEQSPVSVLITDTDGIIEYVNPKFEEVSGYSAEEAIGQNPRMLKSGEKAQKEYQALWATLKQGKVWRGIFLNRKKDGTDYWESASISPVRDGQGEVTHYVGVKEDITARKQAEDQLRMSATVFETTTEGIMVMDGQGLIKRVNPAFTDITGYAAEEAIGQSSRMLSSDRHDQAFFDEMWSHLYKIGNWSGEIWNRRKNGSVYPEWLSIARIKGEKTVVNEYVAIFSDISQLKQTEEQLLYQANYDVLTDLPNRTLLFDRLLQSIVNARREGWKFVVIFADLDRFKVVNDLYGHVVGDELLQLVAGRLKSVIREADTIARFGGDEFVILLHHINGEDDAALVAEKLIQSLSRPFKIADRIMRIGATLGVTLFPDDSSETASLMDEANTLLSNADIAMYQAKASGTNQIRFFQRSMQARIREHLSLEQDLRHALERDELLLYYQPIHEAVGGALVGVEALIRWQHPQRGMVLPVAFIGMAEETGLIGPIGEWVFYTACKQISVWREQRIEGLSLSINLSTRQYNLGFSAEKLASILRKTGLPAENLILEITENLLLDESISSVEWLTDFRKLGVKLAVDDFGTGYSSLSYLKRFPVNSLKIDRSFVNDLPGDKGDESLVRAIVAMADSLGIEVVAEGVETCAQRDFVRNIGCDYMQGYLFGKPMPAEELLARYG